MYAEMLGTATHESSHQLVGFVLGLEVLGCTLHPDGISYGSSRIASPRNRKEAKARLAAIAAGPLSEGERMWPTERVGNGDLYSAARLMGIWELTLIDYVDAEHVAEGILRDHSDALCRLTDALLRSRSLSGDEVRAVLSV